MYKYKASGSSNSHAKMQFTLLFKEYEDRVKSVIEFKDLKDFFEIEFIQEEQNQATLMASDFFRDPTNNNLLRYFTRAANYTHYISNTEDLWTFKFSHPGNSKTTLFGFDNGDRPDIKVYFLKKMINDGKQNIVKKRLAFRTLYVPDKKTEYLAYTSIPFFKTPDENVLKQPNDFDFVLLFMSGPDDSAARLFYGVNFVDGNIKSIPGGLGLGNTPSHMEGWRKKPRYEKKEKGVVFHPCEKNTACVRENRHPGTCKIVLPVQSPGHDSSDDEFFAKHER